MSELSSFLALGIFSAYFLIIIGLFYLILTDLLSTPKQNGPKMAVYTFAALALASFTYTWYYMFRFMTWSFRNFEQLSSIQSDGVFERLTNWLSGTELFEEAWTAVCAGPLNWWWSEQLCLYTVGAWTVFIFTQGQRYDVKYLWAYMLLGQLVAISVASNLFYLAICLSPTPLGTKKSGSPFLAPPKLWLSVLLCLITVGISPLTTEGTFFPNLLLMHTVTFVPLLPIASNKLAGTNSFSIKIPTLYGFITVIALVLRLRTIMSALSYIPPEAQTTKMLAVIAWRTLHSHPAQSSISWDIIWTSISFVVWAAIGRRPKSRDYIGPKVLPLMASTLVASVGVSAADGWRKFEGVEESSKGE